MNAVDTNERRTDLLDFSASATEADRWRTSMEDPGNDMRLPVLGLIRLPPPPPPPPWIYSNSICSVTWEGAV